MSTTVTFDSHFTGELIRPDDPGYDTARQLFNGAIDKRLALIARCAGPATYKLRWRMRASTASRSRYAAAVTPRSGTRAAMTASLSTPGR